MKLFCPSSLELCVRAESEAGLKCQLCTGVGEFPSPGWDEVLSWWEHLIRRAESSNEKSGSSCRWLGGIN